VKEVGGIVAQLTDTCYPVGCRAVGLCPVDWRPDILMREKSHIYRILYFRWKYWIYNV